MMAFSRGLIPEPVNLLLAKVSEVTHHPAARAEVRGSRSESLRAQPAKERLFRLRLAAVHKIKDDK